MFVVRIYFGIGKIEMAIIVCNSLMNKLNDDSNRIGCLRNKGISSNTHTHTCRILVLISYDWIITKQFASTRIRAFSTYIFEPQKYGVILSTSVQLIQHFECIAQPTV